MYLSFYLSACSSDGDALSSIGIGCGTDDDESLCSWSSVAAAAEERFVAWEDALTTSVHLDRGIAPAHRLVILR